MEIIKTKYKKQFKIPLVAASTKYKLPIPQDAIDTHHFFNDLSITNTSTNNIEIVPDNDADRSIFCPAKTIIILSFKDDNMKFSNIYLEEKSGAQLDANLIQIIVTKKRWEDPDPSKGD